MELIQRPRRLRGSDAVRRLCRETRLSPDSLIYPIFVDETLRGKRPIEALPGQFHYGLDAVCEAVSDCLAAGVTHCILFGLPREKDAVGSSAWAKHGVVQEAIRAIKATVEIPVVYTVVSEKVDLESKLAAGIDFVNVSGADRTPSIVAEIRARYPELPVIATGGPTEETILSTIAAGANAITYTPPSNGQLFAKDMHRYREWFAHIDDPEDEDASEETSADDAE